MSDLQAGRAHIAYLDGLRGIAILYVLLSHSSNQGWFLLPNFNMAMAGKTGVWLFFVLSSFLLTSQLLQAYRQGRLGVKYIAKFFVARFFRIYPLYFFTLVLIAALVGWFGYSDILSYLVLQKTSHHLWAIPVEFRFYFVLPLIFYFYVYVCREKIAFFVLAAVVFYVLAFVYDDRLFGSIASSSHVTSLWRHLPVFLLGFIGAVCMQRRVRVSGNMTFVAFVVIIMLTPQLMFMWLGGFGIDLSMMEKRSLVFGVYMELWLGLLWSVVVLGAAEFRRIRWVFETRFLVYTGQISFSLYLLHYFLFAPLRLSSWQPELKAWVFFILSYVVADFSYRYLERNGIKAGKWIVRKFKLAG